MIMKEGIRHNKKNDKTIMNNIFKNEHKYSFAYFAGWADGDGCFDPVEQPTGYTLRIRNEEPVYQLADLYQTSVRLSTPDKRSWINESDPRKVTSLMSHRFIHFAKRVAPFLIDKQKIVLNALKGKGIKNYQCSYMQHDRKQFIEYLAGFLEAEGHFFYRPEQSKYGFEVFNYSENVIKFIKDNLKKYFNIERNINIKKVSKDVCGGRYVANSEYTYGLNFAHQNAVPVLKEILPIMTIDYKIDAATKIINHEFKN